MSIFLAYIIPSIIFLDMTAITKLLNGPIGVLKVLGCMILDLNLIILEATNHVLPSIGKNIVCATFKKLGLLISC